MSTVPQQFGRRTGGFGERALVRSAAARALRCVAPMALFIPFSLAWGGFWRSTGEVTVALGRTRRCFFFALFGLFFVVVGLYLIVGRFSSSMPCNEPSTRTFLRP